MRAALPPLLLVLACLSAPLAQAQAPATSSAPAAGDSSTAKQRIEQPVQNIRHEDEGSRIDEVRVGGETKSITVQPKGNAPAYQVTPESGNRNPAATDRERGSSGWKVLGF
jgi:hypothetical protein